MDSVLSVTPPMKRLARKVQAQRRFFLVQGHVYGKVWLLPCAEGEVVGIQRERMVTNISRDEKTGKVILRIISDEKPGDDAVNTIPSLEDYYMHVFGEQSGDN